MSKITSLDKLLLQPIDYAISAIESNNACHAYLIIKWGIDGSKKIKTLYENMIKAHMGSTTQTQTSIARAKAESCLITKALNLENPRNLIQTTNPTFVNSICGA